MTEWFDCFRAQILAHPRKRLQFEQLLQIFLQCRPELSEHPERLQYLLDALENLAQQRCIELPRGTSAWERISTTNYPRWVSVNRETLLPVVNAQAEPWVKELSFCSTFSNQTQLKAAKAINKFLIARRHDLIGVPLRERSLQIFGDEKKLDAMVRNGHLFDGRLPLSVLGALEIPHYLVHKKFERPEWRHTWRVLVVENHDTYWSICQWNTGVKAFDAVIYGAGLFFQKSEMFLDEISAQVIAPEFFYFGDIDPAGFDIPLSVNRRRGNEGRHLLRAYMPFYQWTLENGQRTENNSSRTAFTGLEKLSDFTSSDFAGDVQKLFDAKERIPQESLGLEVLLAKFPGNFL